MNMNVCISILQVPIHELNLLEQNYLTPSKATVWGHKSEAKTIRLQERELLTCKYWLAG